MHAGESVVDRDVSDAFEASAEQGPVLGRGFFDVNAVRVRNHPEANMGEAGAEGDADAAVAVVDQRRDGDEAHGDLRVGERAQIVVERGEGLVELLRCDGVVEIFVVGHHGLAHGQHIFTPLGVGEMPCGGLSEE